jgi:hypothetical protein
MAEEAPNSPDQQKPETLGDPVLIEADEALKRASDTETSRTDRLENNDLIVGELRRILKNVNEKITEEENKDPDKRDAKKLERLYERKASLTQKIDEILARPDQRADKKLAQTADTLEQKAGESKEDIAELQRLKAERQRLQGEIDALKASTKPEDISKVSELYKQLDKVNKDIAKLEKKGTEEQQQERYEARIAMAKKARAMVEADHAEEVRVADKALEDFMEGKEDSTEKGETPEGDKKEGEAKPEGPQTPEEEAAARRSEILHNRLDRISYNLSTELIRSYPGEDANVFDKTVWTAKGFLLRLSVAFGGKGDWADLLDERQKEFMEKKVGMQVTKETVKDGEHAGEEKTVIKWIKPVEGWEPIPTGIADVFDKAFGEDKDAALKEIKAETTLKDYAATVPPNPSTPMEQAKARLVQVLRDEIKVPEGTKIQEYLSSSVNADRVLSYYEPQPKEDPKDEAAEEAEAEPELSKQLEIIKEKKLNESSTLQEAAAAGLMGPVPGKVEIFSELDPKVMAKAKVESLKTPGDLTTLAQGLSDLVQMLQDIGIHIPALPQDLVEIATKELTANQQLSAETAQKLEAALSSQFKAIQDIGKLSLKQILEKDVKDATEEDKKHNEAILAALQENNPPAEPAAPPAEK